MVLKEQSIIELLEELKKRRWSDAAIGRELDVSQVAVWRWRNNERKIARPNLTRRILEELLERL